MTVTVVSVDAFVHDASCLLSLVPVFVQHAFGMSKVLSSLLIYQYKRCLAC